MGYGSSKPSRVMTTAVPTYAHRIVSLVPSLTELICDLDLADSLVARTGFCIHPKDILRSIPKVGGTKDVDVEAVKALQPTHLIVNVDENRKEVVDELRPHVGEVVVTHPLGPLDNLELYQRFGEIFGRQDQARRLCDEFRAVMPGAIPNRPVERVLYLIWRDPWMTVSCDTYISRMLAAFGWQTWVSSRSQRYPTLELAECHDAIDRVLLSSEPYPFRQKHIAEIEDQLPGIPVQLIDGEMVSWYGSRAIAGLRYLRDFTATP
jgi:ABC-type Fe3+-hydroxamate transport system substrate-binding protein